jgi:hypothetical protein
MVAGDKRFRQAARYQRAAIERYLATLPATAPLHAVAGSREINTTIAQFEAADAEALAAQERYRKWGLRGLTATTCGVLIGALLLMPLDAWFNLQWRIAVGALQTLMLLITFGAALLILWLRPLDQWMSFRAEAERLRGEIFRTILATSSPPSVDAKALALQKLELLKSAYIDDQLKYFRRRAREHRRYANQASPLRLFAYALIVLGAVLGSASLIRGFGFALPRVLECIVDWLALPNLSRWQLGLTTIASGVLAFTAQRSLMNEDARKAALYTVTADRLTRVLENELPSVRAVATNGDSEAVNWFFKTVRTILEQEHAVWSYMRTDEKPQ